MAESHTLAEVVRRRAALEGERDAYVFLWEGRAAPDPRAVSYAELDREARRLAGWLARAGAAGGRVLILQGAGRHFAPSLLGCWYAGAIAVPAPPPGGGLGHADRLLGIVKDAQVAAVLTDTASAAEVSQRLAAAGYGQVACLAVDNPHAVGDTADDAGCPDPDAVALLQYTSGSTGEAKGVMVTHRNLMANQRAIAELFGSDRDTVVGGWLPFHHDMGLVGHLLHPLWLGTPGVLMSPGAFLRRPVRWLELVSEYGVTASAAPTFGYERALRRIPPDQIARLDLSGWRTAVVGAEPVRAETLRAFAERFAPAGLRPQALRPAYGLAEATLLVTGAGSGSRGPRELVVDATRLEAGELHPAVPGTSRRTLVSSGAPAGSRVHIVDPESRQALADGRVGEIWVRGEGVTAGYWKRPYETRAAFDATTAEGEGGFLRTGDLGVLDGGELYVTGRIKDLVIMDGRNLYPHDVERRVEAANPLCRTGVVFGVESEGEHMILVQEVNVSRAVPHEYARLSKELVDCVAEDFQVDLGSVVLVRPGTIRRTTSGKLQRSAVRRLFLSGSLSPLYEELDPAVRDLRSAAPALAAPSRWRKP
ncbi:fatty acyl-AMP ligase [Kitasatospora sp. NPDC087314]|uniref:fatty acyl-AMP ligase n=1 Tax=Kitasatospora sp. NPDC087314 TaxID=3364068 RepID=UPI00380EB6AE